MPRSFPRAEVGRATGAAVVRYAPVESGGYGTNTAHWRAELADGRDLFVKVALDETSAAWLRDELRVYSSVDAEFLAEFRGWYDHPGTTLLALEDLSAAYWPPPWRAGDVDAVLGTLDAVHATSPPAGLPRLDAMRDRLDGWPVVAADPEPLLATGLCSREWLVSALPELARASASCALAGEALLHLDVRSDNLCLRDGRAVLVDWNLACVGNPLVDVVAWLASLRLEGGPDPWDVVSDSHGLAALVSGFFCCRAGLPPPPTAPRVRDFQRRQGEVALAWAARELGLPPILAA